MRLYAIALVGVSFLTFPFLAQKMSKEASDSIQIIGVNPTPESETIVTTIQIPKKAQVLSGSRTYLQIRVDGYSLGTNSQFDRASEIANSDRGQTIHIVVDDNPYFIIDSPSVEPFNEDGWYYNENYRVEIPGKLKEGLHVVRAFPARSFGESLKGDKTFHASYFFIGKEQDVSLADVLDSPYLTYNEPSDQLKLVHNQPVLLDFYVTNCILSPDGYKVKLTLDGKIHRMLTSWQPYYIYGLKKGSHTIRLQLIDRKGKEVSDHFNSIERRFTVH